MIVDYKCPQCPTTVKADIKGKFDIICPVCRIVSSSTRYMDIQSYPDKAQLNNMPNNPQINATELAKQCDDSINRFYKNSGVKPPTNDWSLLPWDALTEVVEVMTISEEKHKGKSFLPGVYYRTHVAAAWRHLSSWSLGIKEDPETKCNPLAHAIVRLLILLHYELNPSIFSSMDNRNIKRG